MAQARGTQTTIALYEEANYNTPIVTPSGQKLYVTSFGLSSSQNLLDSTAYQPIGQITAVNGAIDTGQMMPISRARCRAHAGRLYMRVRKDAANIVDRPCGYLGRVQRREPIIQTTPRKQAL